MLGAACQPPEGSSPEKLLQGMNCRMKNKKTMTDVQLVLKASSRLGISEFQIISDAWRAWYDENPNDKQLEPYFIDFLVCGTVPFWLRSYARFILGKKDLAALERRRLLVGAMTYYVPLLLFFCIIMWSIYR